MSSAGIVDLHCHSVFSDGTFSPETLVEQAARARLQAFSITDHDTIMGFERAQTAADRLGVNLIPGVEVSAHCQGTCVHILGYYFDPQDSALRIALEEIAHIRLNRIGLIVKRLRALGVDITTEEVMCEGAEGTWGRPHVARALLRRKLVRDFDDAFKRYLGNDRPAYVPRNELSAADAIALIHKAGGVAVLAHPFAYRLRDLSRKKSLPRLLDALVEARLDGIEVVYSNCSSQDSATLMREARLRGLSFSGGSDYHGTVTPRVRLGVGRGNLKVPSAWLEELRDRSQDVQAASAVSA